ncbi:hypothetical protein [Kitasatospora cystarginea]
MGPWSRFEPIRALGAWAGAHGDAVLAAQERFGRVQDLRAVAKVDQDGG